MLAARLLDGAPRRAEPDRRLAGLQSEIVAIALSGGVSVERALAVTTAAGAGEIEADVHAMLRLSRRAGARAVELLRADAAEQRRRARTDGRLRAARLSSRLLLPMGVCTLPAFLLLGVAPLLISVLSGSTPSSRPRDRRRPDVPPSTPRESRTLHVPSFAHHAHERRGHRPAAAHAATCARALRRRVGAATAEYAVATMAAVAFAGLLVMIMRSDEVRGILTDSSAAL
jgi:hypothetical protein